MKNEVQIMWKIFVKNYLPFLNAFVDNNNGGNPANDLSTSEKLKIAKTVGLSETAFVSTSETADFKLDLSEQVFNL